MSISIQIWMLTFGVEALSAALTKRSNLQHLSISDLRSWLRACVIHPIATILAGNSQTYRPASRNNLQHVILRGRTGHAYFNTYYDRSLGFSHKDGRCMAWIAFPALRSTC